jgi:hypothetical protein
MKRILITAILAAVLGAASVSPEQLKACEASLREKNKADKANAPEGYKVSRPRNFRQTFLAECLSK